MTTTSPGFNVSLVTPARTELARAAPLDRVTHHLPVLLLHHDVNEGVRIAKQELHQLAFNGDGLVFQIRGREGVMGIRCWCPRHTLQPPAAQPEDASYGSSCRSQVPQKSLTNITRIVESRA